MGLILDSSVVIAAERAGQTAYQMVQTMGSDDTELALSVVTILELAHGVARANTEARHTIRQRFLQDLLSGMPVHPVTVPIAMRAGHIDGLLRAQGLRVALADLLIGATALELGFSIVTNNVRHFEMIPDLEIRQR